MEEKTNIVPETSENEVKPASHHSSEYHGSAHHHHSSGRKSSHHRHHTSSKSSKHHHSSKHSSSHSHKSKRKKPSAKTYARRRAFFSFVLFLTISATAILGALKISVLNESRMANIFTNSTYLNAMHDDVMEYSKDLCLKCGIPDSYLDNVITYKSISEIQKAYILGNLDMDEMYSESSYVDMIGRLNDNIATQTKNVVEENRLEFANGMETKGPQQFADEVTAYLKSRVEFKYLEDIQSIVNVSSPVLNVGMILFAVLSVAFLLLTISFVDKKYRALRAVCYSIFGASALDMFLVICVGIVSIFKDLLIYPSYFCDSVMGYINFCVSTFLIEGILLFLFGVMVGALVWRIKRNND